VDSGVDRSRLHMVENMGCQSARTRMGGLSTSSNRERIQDAGRKVCYIILEGVDGRCGREGVFGERLDSGLKRASHPSMEDPPLIDDLVHPSEEQSFQHILPSFILLRHNPRIK